MDWLGVDGYNFSSDNGSAWTSFSGVFGKTYNELVNLAPGKPIMIGETGTSADGGSKPAWITDAVGYQLPVNFPMIRALVWFNWNAGDPAMDWPIQTTPESTAAFAGAISSSYYTSNQYANLPAGPVAPPTK